MDGPDFFDYEKYSEQYDHPTSGEFLSSVIGDGTKLWDDEAATC